MNKTDLIQGTVIEIAGAEGAPKQDVLVAKLRRSAVENDPCVEIALISLGEKREMPFIVSWSDFESRIASGTYTITTKNAESLAIRSLEDVPEHRRNKFKRIKTANKARIQAILDLGWGAFEAVARGAEVAAVAAGDRGHQRCSPTWLRELLITYWRTGENELSLGPDYAACGGPTRAERRRKLVASGGETIPLRRCGPKIKHFPIGENGVEPISGVDEPGRGGCVIPINAEPVIEDLINAYLKDKEHRVLIDKSLERWNGLPWLDITKYVTRGLRDYPPFAGMQPSRRQVSYIGARSVDLLGTLRLVKGSRYSNLNNRTLSGDYRDVSKFAGMRYEIDISPMDIHLVDDITGMGIGRVFVIYIVDRFTGMIAGVYVTTDNVDFAHVGRALHCAFSNKVAWCKTIGLEIGPDDWPCEGRCEEGVADNAQLASKDGMQIAEYLMDIGLARPYRGDDKPGVESAFDSTEHGFVHRFSYGVSSGPKERGKDDPSKEACISVSAFTRELVRWVVYTHNHRAYPVTRFLEPAFLKLRKKTSPFEYWKWSIRKLGGPLKKYDPALMMPRLLKRIEANMTEMGIEVEGQYFDRPDDEGFQHQKRLATCGGTRKVAIYVDELTTRLVYLESPDAGGAPTPCPLAHVSRENADLTFKEVRIRREFRIGLQLATQAKADKNAEKQQAHQRAALAAGRHAVKTQHGGFKSRNKKARGIDKEATRQIQGAADNQRNTDTMHGAMAAAVTKAQAKPSKQKSAPVRPSSYA